MAGRMAPGCMLCSEDTTSTAAGGGFVCVCSNPHQRYVPGPFNSTKEKSSTIHSGEKKGGGREGSKYVCHLWSAGSRA